MSFGNDGNLTPNLGHHEESVMREPEEDYVGIADLFYHDVSRSGANPQERTREVFEYSSESNPSDRPSNNSQDSSVDSRPGPIHLDSSEDCNKTIFQGPGYVSVDDNEEAEAASRGRRRSRDEGNTEEEAEPAAHTDRRSHSEIDKVEKEDEKVGESSQRENKEIPHSQSKRIRIEVPEIREETVVRYSIKCKECSDRVGSDDIVCPPCGHLLCQTCCMVAVMEGLGCKVCNSCFKEVDCPDNPQFELMRPVRFLQPDEH